MPVNAIDVISRTVKPFEIAKAVAASFQKHFFIKDTFVRGRIPFRRYQSSVTGDMAKLLVKTWLEENGFTVIDWDDARTSWRTQRKPYDLKVNEHEIEVRSSFSKYTSVQQLLAKEHIIHPCNVRVKEITVQVFWRDKQCTEAWLSGWARKTDLEDNSLVGVRRVNGRLVDFYMMPFSHPNAMPVNQLPNHL